MCQNQHLSQFPVDVSIFPLDSSNYTWPLYEPSRKQNNIFGN